MITRSSIVLSVCCKSRNLTFLSFYIGVIKKFDIKVV